MKLWLEFCFSGNCAALYMVKFNFSSYSMLNFPDISEFFLF